MFTPLGAKIYGNRIFEFVAKTQFQSRENSEPGKFLTDYHYNY